MYSLIDKIVGAYKDNEEARTWEDMYQSQIAATQHWMKKATDMEKKLREILSNGMQSTLDVKA